MDVPQEILDKLELLDKRDPEDVAEVKTDEKEGEDA